MLEHHQESRQVDGKEQMMAENSAIDSTNSEESTDGAEMRMQVTRGLRLPLKDYLVLTRLESLDGWEGVERPRHTPQWSSRGADHPGKAKDRELEVLLEMLLLLSQGAAAPSVDEGVEDVGSLLLSQGVAAPSVDEGI